MESLSALPTFAIYATMRGGETVKATCIKSKLLQGGIGLKMTLYAFAAGLGSKERVEAP